MTNKIIGGIAVVALVVAFLAYTKTGQSVVQQLGAQPVQVTDGDCYFLNGLHQCPAEVGMKLASTTASFKSPNATSTVAFNTTFCRVASTSASAILFEAGRSLNPYSTTTSFVTATLAANTTGMFVATTSPTTSIDGNYVFPPNSYLNIKLGGELQLGGKCGTTFVY